MPPTRLLVTTAALVLAVTTACGGDDRSGVASLSQSTSTSGGDTPGGGGSTASGLGAEFEDAMVEFAKCMRENGIDFPDPGSGGGHIGPDSDLHPEDPDFKAAEAECKPILDEAERSVPKPSEEELAKMRDSMLAFARCMRGEGVDFPDPDLAEGGRIEGRVSDLDDPDFQKAQEKCTEETGGIGLPRKAPARNDR